MAKRTLLLVSGFLVAIVAVFILGYHIGNHVRRIRWANEPIRPWMSVPFIAHTHHVPVDLLFQAIHVQRQQPRDRRPLRRIAREEKRPVDELIRDLNDAIARARGSTSPPPPAESPRKVP